MIPSLLAFATYVFAVHQVQGRHLEGWLLVLVQYLRRPKVFVWCSVLRASTEIQETASLEETHAPDLADLEDEENDQ